MQSRRRELEQLARLSLHADLKCDRRNPFRFTAALNQNDNPFALPGQREASERFLARQTFGRRRRRDKESCELALVERQLRRNVARRLDEPALLETRCPHEHRVGMMVDRQGRIHLWRGPIEGDINADIVSLINARHWVREKIQLIAKARPDLSFDAGAEPMLHVFTQDARQARALDGTLGPFLKFHVLECESAAQLSETRGRKRWLN